MQLHTPYRHGIKTLQAIFCCIFFLAYSLQSSAQIDLELNLNQPNSSPSQWTSYEVTATLTNSGPQTATGIWVALTKPAGVVYTGGQEFVASKGSFSPYSNESWNIDQLDAGETAVITFSYFLLQPQAPVAYGQVGGANETDTDSTPGNGTPPNVNEDDEASTAAQVPNTKPDLSPSNLQVPANVEQSTVPDFSFDLNNFGAATASGSYIIRAFLSLDDQPGGNDILVGEIQTGNTPIGTIANVPGSFTVPPALAPGNYFLVLYVDLRNDIDESNENNNIIAQALTVSFPTSGEECGFLETYGLQPSNTFGRIINNAEEVAGHYQLTYDYRVSPTGENRRTKLTIGLDGRLNAAVDMATPPSLAGVKVTIVADTILQLENLDDAGNVIWTNQVVYETNEPLTDYVLPRSFKVADGYFIMGTVVLSQGSSLIPFIIKTDLQGNKLNQDFLDVPRDVYSYIGIYGDGPYYTRLFRIEGEQIVAIDTDGNFLWRNALAGDLPSTDVNDIRISPDKSAVFGVIYDNRKARIAKYNAATGVMEWNIRPGNVFPPDEFTFEFIQSVIPTPDGGIVFGYTFQVAGGSERGYEYGKLDADGVPQWWHRLPEGYDLKPAIMTSDGGFLFVGNNEENDAAMKITSSGELVPACGGTTGEGVDLELKLSADSGNPSIYTNSQFTLTISNTGSQAASGITVDFPKPDRVVYTGNDEFVTTQGDFNPYGDQVWTVGTLAAGETAIISVSYFTLTADPFTAYAQVLTLNEPDLDSTPGNGSCCTAVEDDEAAFTTGGSTIRAGERTTADGTTLKAIDIQRIFPNPLSNSQQLQIYLLAAADGQEVVEVYSTRGQLVYQKPIRVEEGFNAITLELERLNSGTYQLVIPGRDLRHMPSRFMVIRP